MQPQIVLLAKSMRMDEQLIAQIARELNAIPLPEAGLPAHRAAVETVSQKVAEGAASRLRVDRAAASFDTLRSLQRAKERP